MWPLRLRLLIRLASQAYSFRIGLVLTDSPTPWPRATSRGLPAPYHQESGPAADLGNRAARARRRRAAPGKSPPARLLGLRRRPWYFRATPSPPHPISLFVWQTSRATPLYPQTPLRPPSPLVACGPPLPPARPDGLSGPHERRHNKAVASAGRVDRAGGRGS